MNPKPRAGFYNFSGCSGCLLTILNCEDNILDIFGAAQVVSFLMANRGNVDESWHGNGKKPGPEANLDVAFIDGSVTTRAQEEFLKEIRERSKQVVALGVCSCYGGVQAMETGRSNYAKRFQKVYGAQGPRLSRRSSPNRSMPSSRLTITSRVARLTASSSCTPMPASCAACRPNCPRPRSAPSANGARTNACCSRTNSASAR